MNNPQNTSIYCLVIQKSNHTQKDTDFCIKTYKGIIL